MIEAEEQCVSRLSTFVANAAASASLVEELMNVAALIKLLAKEF